MNITKPEQVLGIQLLSTYMNTIAGKDKSGAFDLVMQAVMDSIEKGNTNESLQSFLDSMSDSLGNGYGYNIEDLDKLPSYESTGDYSLDSLKNLSSSALNNAYKQLTSSVKGSTAQINAAVSKAAKKYGVDEALIHSIIKNESSYNQYAVSSAGAMGLMQLMPVNCKEDGVSDPFNIEQNIEGGTKQLKKYLKMYNGNIEMSLMAYNAGQGTVARRGVTSVNDLYKMPKETQNYVKKVMATYKSLL